jgi:hypothetical protein
MVADVRRTLSLGVSSGQLPLVRTCLAYQI